MSKPPSPVAPVPRRRMQFTLLGLMVVMVAVSVAAAPAYYLARGMEGSENMHLIGMIFVLAGPMLLMTVISLLLAASRRWNGR